MVLCQAAQLAESQPSKWFHAFNDLHIINPVRLIATPQVGDLMAGNAAQVDQEVVLGEASILQVMQHRVLTATTQPQVNQLRSRDSRLAGVGPGDMCHTRPEQSLPWQVFPLKGSKGESGGAVAGCRVSEGTLKSAMQFRVLRDGEVSTHTIDCQRSTARRPLIHCLCATVRCSYAATLASCPRRCDDLTR